MCVCVSSRICGNLRVHIACDHLPISSCIARSCMRRRRRRHARNALNFPDMFARSRANCSSLEAGAGLMNFWTPARRRATSDIYRGGHAAAHTDRKTGRIIDWPVCNISPQRFRAQPRKAINLSATRDKCSFILVCVCVVWWPVCPCVYV